MKTQFPPSWLKPFKNLELSLTQASFISEPGNGLGLSLLGLISLLSAPYSRFFKKTITRGLI